MKQSRCTESQIVAILKEADAGVPVNEVWRKHGICSATYLHMEGQIRRARCLGVKARQGTGSRKRQAQAHVCGVVLGEPSAQGLDRKKVVMPPAKREVVQFLNQEHRMPIRRASDTADWLKSRVHGPPGRPACPLHAPGVRLRF